MSGPSIADFLVTRIARDGPLSVAEYMGSVAEAYYAQGTAFGKDGDFVTAPEISQIFGELIGLWCVTAWQALGQPRLVNLVECGPGRGTLMVDALRAIGDVAPAFLKAASVHLIETSPTLRLQQQGRLTIYDSEWHEDFSTLPPGQIIIVGNEFLDALPIQQFERTNAGWRERLVDYNDGNFVFGLSPIPTTIIDDAFDDAPLGSIIEYSESVETNIREMVRLCLERRGIGLMIDYGHTLSDIGDTLQAMKHHTYHPVLEDPGTADITAHVDFGLVTQTIRSSGADVFGPLEQGIWLRRIGATVREAQLCAGKSKEDIQKIKSGVRRIIEPDGMGTLFKAIAWAPPGVGPLAGFEAEG